MRIFAVAVLAVVTVASAYSLYDPPRTVPRVDYSLGMVFLERWRGDYFVGVERVLPLEDYLSYQLSQSVTDAAREKAKKTQEKQDLAADASGLIPDINLPKLPIFGEGSKIDISGKDRITLGGRQTFIHKANQDTSKGLFPELKMAQELSVTLNGTIGERTKVSIDHDTERQENKNKVMLSYTGTEDDVIQSVELGDTRLTIPSTGYTGDLPTHHGLFGATAKGKVGGVDVYAVASREQSQSQTQTFSGRRRTSVDTVYEYRYVTRRFYHIEAPGTIRNVRVYVDDRNPGNNQSGYPAIATVYPAFPDSLPGEWTYDRAPGYFDLKAFGTDYVLQPGNVLEFANALNPSDVVGLVIYTDSGTIGGESWHDSLVLKLLKPEMPDSLSLTWDYEMRNVYALPEQDISLGSFRLQYNTGQQTPVETDTAGTNVGRKFTDILGLDPNGDGRLEYPEFDGKTGLIRFPGRRPFDTTALSTRDPFIYRVDPSNLEPAQGRVYRMVVEYSSATESYYLGQLDITENTEKVVVGGDEWKRDVDYTVNYKTGVLSFIRALPPNADIQVTYEYRPLFSLADKSLVGGRAEWNLFQQGKLGTSVFYRDEGIREDKPALGSEPFRRTIAETDASYALTSDAVTAFLDRLPLLRAQSQSSLRVQAEGAISLPDPNTRGVAYLDDFEGTTITRDVSITSMLWSFSSVPVATDTAHFARQPVLWRNLNLAERVRNDSVFGPSIGEDEGRETHDLLRVVYTPDSADAASWAGIMTCPTQAGISMSLKDVENLRMIMRSRTGQGRIHVTVGMSIDEDAPRRDRLGRIAGYNGREDTEDRNHNGQLDAEDEDTGLDGVFGVDSLWDGTDTLDDGNDDYSSTNPNGTERNNQLDGEDLDRTGFSRYNHYFECDLNLGDERYFTTLYRGWQVGLVPLKDSLIFHSVGKPKWEDIRLVRVWFDGFTDVDTIDFYSIEFVGSRWTAPVLTAAQDSVRPPSRVPSDTSEKAWVTQISRKTDTTYVPPFEPKRDANNKVEQEAALLLGYRQLRPGREVCVTKTSADREDYREYSDMRVFVHDDGNGTEYLLRIGQDSANYYEYVARVTDGNLVPGRDGKWYEFVLKLDSFPNLKVQTDRARGFPSELWGRGRYRVKGNPSLADIRYTALGLKYSGSSRGTGGLWFDDMRLTAPRKDAGYGFQASTSLALSDFVTAGASFNYSDPNFRRFSESRGVKTGGFGTSLAGNVRANLDRLLPFGWGLSIPLGYAISDVRDKPKYSPIHPDLLLPALLAAGYSTRGRSEELALDNVRKQKSSSKILNYTLEAMGASWRQRRAWNLAALSQDTSWSSAWQWNYAVAPDLKVKVGRETDLSLFPNDVHLGLAGGEQGTFRRSRLSPDSAFRTDTLKGSGLNTDFGVDYSPVEDLTFEYGTQTERDLTVPLEFQDSLWFVATGAEVGTDHSFSAGYNLEVGDVLTPSVDFNGDYSDDRTKTGRTYSSTRNMNNSGELELALGFDLPELLSRFEPPKSKSLDVKPRPASPGPQAPSPKPESVPGDTQGVKRESTVARPRQSVNPWLELRRGAAGLGRSLEAIDFTYSISRSSDLIGVGRQAPWTYVVGLADRYIGGRLKDSLTNATRDRRYTLRVSSGGHVKDLSARLSYEWAQGSDINDIYNTVALDRGVTWPDVELTQGKVHSLFKSWATDSKLSCSYRRRHDLTGQYPPSDTAPGETLGMIGRTESFQNELSPLVSWTTTWKKRVTTTLSANYSFGTSTNYLDDSGVVRSVTGSRAQGGRLSLGYTFSAPQGLKLPFLRRVRFSSDLTVTWSLDYSQSHKQVQRWTGVLADTAYPLAVDNSFSSDLAASYRFSRSIEAGLKTGYRRGQNGITKLLTESTDLDLWVLFRF
jgi:hypothetical protein